MRNFTLGDWKLFVPLLTQICGEGLFDGDFLFRGQADWDWKLETSYDRNKKASLVVREREFEAVLSRFEEMLVFRGFERCSRPELMGLAQHYALPTRILDWSKSPYVAAFFACADSFKLSTPTSAIFVMNVRELRDRISKSELEIIDYVPGPNERLRNQRGCFTALKTETDSLDAFFEAKGLSDIIAKVRVTKDVYHDALKHLASMDISYDRLFPGIDGVAKQVWLETLLQKKGS